MPELQPWQLEVAYLVIAGLVFWLFVVWSRADEDACGLGMLAVLWPLSLAFMAAVLFVMALHRSARMVRAWAERP